MQSAQNQSAQNVRVAARSRIFGAHAQEQSSAPEDWLPAAFRPPADGGVEEAEAVPADPAAAAELGAEVQRLRRELKAATERADAERRRAERAESEAAKLRERAEAMKRAAARAAAAAHPHD